MISKKIYNTILIILLTTSFNIIETGQLSASEQIHDSSLINPDSTYRICPVSTLEFP